jgi:phage portal protein BeeE
MPPRADHVGVGHRAAAARLADARLNPLLVRIEQAARKQLLPLAERKKVYPEFKREAVMAADSAGRAALYSAFGQNGVMDRNEMRSARISITAPAANS